MDESLTATDPERTIEFEFVRATENAALNVLPGFVVWPISELASLRRWRWLMAVGRVSA